MRICNFFCPIFYFKRQSCSRLFSVVRHLVAATFCLYTSFAVFSQVNTDAYSQPQSQAQSMPTMPSLPSIQSVTMPSLGTDFYSPKNPVAPAKPTSPNASQSNSARSSAASSAAPAASGTSPSSSASSATTTTATTSPVSAASNSTALSALAGDGNFAGVSAADMMLLDRAGLLNFLPTNLSSTDFAVSNLPIAQNGMANENANKKVLENILTQLNELKAQVAAIGNGSAEKSDAPVATSVNGASVRVRAMQSKNDNAQILRFVVNGYDMKSSCRTVYFSERGADGTFLMTADRRYMSDNISRTETFYLLFKSKGTTDNGIEYDVIPSVIQDYENQYSFLYQLSQKQNLSAAKTGNLVTLRVTEPNWNMDLLLDISDTVRN